MEEEIEYLETEHGIISSNPITGQTAREVYQEGLDYYFKLVDGEYVRLTDEELNDKVIEIPKTEFEILQEENKRLWDAVEYLLKQVDAGIPQTE